MLSGALCTAWPSVARCSYVLSRTGDSGIAAVHALSLAIFPVGPARLFGLGKHTELLAGGEDRSSRENYTGMNYIRRWGSGRKRDGEGADLWLRGNV